MNNILVVLLNFCNNLKIFCVDQIYKTNITFPIAFYFLSSFLYTINIDLFFYCSKMTSGSNNGGSAVSADPAERRGNALTALRALCESSALQPYLMQLLTAK